MSSTDIPSLVLISQRFAEILSNFLFGCFVANFDWLYQIKGFENQIHKYFLCEGCSGDDVCQFWGRLEKNGRSRLLKVFDKTGNGG